MIAGTGVDIVGIVRIRNLLDRWGDRFAGKILTELEMERFKSRRRDRAAYLARQFAAKEAVSKALGTGMRAGVHFRQIEVLRKSSGAPSVHLSGAAQKRSDELGVGVWNVSISDETEFAVAMVIAERKQRESS